MKRSLLTFALILAAGLSASPAAAQFGGRISLMPYVGYGFLGSLPDTEAELEAAGVNVVIYANQLLRGAYPAMMRTAESILRHGRSLEADEHLMSIKDILHLIPGGS